MANDLATILSLSPQNESWMRRIFKILHEIEKQKSAGISFSMMARALGLESAQFRVYLHRARKRATNLKTVGGSISTVSSITAIKPVAESDVKTPEGRRAAQAARFNINVLNDEE